jgi:hypothetical protein
MNHSKLQSIEFDGSIAFNDATELLEYVQLLTGIIPDDNEHCIINGEKYYYNDVITPLFDIFAAILLAFPTLTSEQQNTISLLEDYSDLNKYRIGSCGITLDDIYDHDENNFHYGIRHIYELLGGIAPTTDDAEAE